ncbi:KR domain-containing protein, partial [Streptomyces sp. 4N509B]|uniref:KR domain-containing protein n=1 Tax=Streptomyces sp. 4N509B TaxID=3457413 RepID=UPI003FD2C193
MEVHGVRRLVLVGRRVDGVGVGEFVGGLVGLGVVVDVVACDVGDREGLLGVVGGVSVDHPLTAVVHVAGVVDDGVVEGLSVGRLGGVLGPKVGGGWLLHEVTAACDLRAFVVFSSLAGVVGAGGQGAYAAANAGVDGLVGYRRGLGLPGVSLAWGLWEERSGLTAGVGVAEEARMEQGG